MDYAIQSNAVMDRRSSIAKSCTLYCPLASGFYNEATIGKYAFKDLTGKTLGMSWMADAFSSEADFTGSIFGKIPDLPNSVGSVGLDMMASSSVSPLKTPQLSAALFIKPVSFLQPFMQIFGIGGFPTFPIQLFLTSGGKLGLNVNTIGNGFANIYNGTGNFTLSADNWYHIAVTFDGLTFNTYVNGQLDFTSTLGGYTGLDYSAAGTEIFQIGYSDNQVGQDWRAQAAHVVMCNRGLTKSEVQLLYSNPRYLISTNNFMTLGKAGAVSSSSQSNMFLAF